MGISDLKRHSFAVRYLTLFGGEGISKLCAFAAFAYLARTLGPRDFGTVELSLSITVFLMLGVESGLGSYGARLIERSPGLAATLIPQVAVLRFMLGAPAYLTILIVSRTLWDAGPRHPGDLRHPRPADAVFHAVGVSGAAADAMGGGGQRVALWRVRPARPAADPKGLRHPARCRGRGRRGSSGRRIQRLRHSSRPANPPGLARRRPRRDPSVQRDMVSRRQRPGVGRHVVFAQHHDRVGRRLLANVRGGLDGSGCPDRDGAARVRLALLLQHDPESLERDSRGTGGVARPARAIDVELAHGRHVCSRSAAPSSPRSSSRSSTERRSPARSCRFRSRSG